MWLFAFNFLTKLNFTVEAAGLMAQNKEDFLITYSVFSRLQPP